MFPPLAPSDQLSLFLFRREQRTFGYIAARDISPADQLNKIRITAQATSQIWLTSPDVDTSMEVTKQSVAASMHQIAAKRQQY
jgi:hypothetical protein